MHVRALRKRGSCQCVQCPGASDGALVVPWAVPVQASVEKIEKHTPVEEELQARPSSRSTVDSVLAVPPATTGLDYYPNGLAAAKEMALKKNKEIMDKVGPGMARRVSHSIHCCWAGRHRPRRLLQPLCQQPAAERCCAGLLMRRLCRCAGHALRAW